MARGIFLLLFCLDSNVAKRLKGSSSIIDLPELEPSSDVFTSRPESLKFSDKTLSDELSASRNNLANVLFSVGGARSVRTSRPRQRLISRTAAPRLQSPSSDVVKNVVVIGGGWAGYTAADAISGSPNCNVTLLEASPRAAGGLAGGWRTPSGRPVEAGIHGFWREYRNTFKVIEDLGLELDTILTPFTPSVLFSSRGKVATAPVLGQAKQSRTTQSNAFPDLMETIAESLPAPLDTALLADFSPTSPLTFIDRASAVGLLASWADFSQEDPASWERYDKISAEELFKRYGGVTDTLYDELVSPLLHALPMAPGYDISAAAALSCFHVFALQSRGAFDVRWCRGGITDRIFKPWQKRLEKRANVRLQSGARVKSIDYAKDSKNRFAIEIQGQTEKLEADAVILAIGGTAAARLAGQSPALKSIPAIHNFGDLRGITCVAVRLYLKPSSRTQGLQGGSHSSTLAPGAVAEAMKASPVSVVGPGVGGLPELSECGFCIYDLQRMQDEFAVGNLSVLEVDFYRADKIANIEDDNVVAAFAMKASALALGVSQSELDPGMVVDVAVVRARNAVSHFCVGSASTSPSIRLDEGLFACGDWIDRSGHASWSTEKAVVTAKQAAGALSEDFQLQGVDAKVIPAAEDTPQLQALRQIARVLRASVPKTLPFGTDKTDQLLPPPAPWALLKDLLDDR